MPAWVPSIQVLEKLSMEQATGLKLTEIHYLKNYGICHLSFEWSNGEKSFPNGTLDDSPKLSESVPTHFSILAFISNEWHNDHEYYLQGMKMFGKDGE